MSNCSYYRSMNNSFLFVAAFLAFVQFSRYLLMAGGTYYLVWVRNNEKYLQRKIQPQPFDRKRIRAEVINSFWFSIISAMAFALPFWEPLAKYSKLYTDPSQYSLAWLILSLPLLIILQDTYFYWMHRLIHHPALYSRVHKEHHESRDPSPFAAYSFHWIEGLLEVAWFIPLMFVLPLHHGVIYVFGIISLVFNINGHLGVDLFPKHWENHAVFKWLNTATRHNHHHKYFKGNYGFYFSFWDRIMKTETKLPSAKSTGQAA